MKIRQMIADGGLNLEQIQTLIPSALFPLAGGGFSGLHNRLCIEKNCKTGVNSTWTNHIIAWIS